MRETPEPPPLQIEPAGLAAVESFMGEINHVLDLRCDATLVPVEWNLSVDQYPIEWGPVVERHRQYARETLAELAQRKQKKTILQKITAALNASRLHRKRLCSLPPVLSGQHPATFETLVEWLRVAPHTAVVSWIRTQPVFAHDGESFRKLCDVMRWLYLPYPRRASTGSSRGVHPWRAHLALVAIALSPTMSAEFLIALGTPRPEMPVREQVDVLEVADDASRGQSPASEASAVADWGTTATAEEEETETSRLNCAAGGVSPVEEGGAQRRIEQDGQPREKGEEDGARRPTDIDGSAPLQFGEMVSALRARAAGRGPRENEHDVKIYEREYWEERSRQATIACLPDVFRLPDPRPADLAYLVPLATYQIEQVLAARKGALTFQDIFPGEKESPSHPSVEMENTCWAMTDSLAESYGTIPQWRALMEQSLNPALHRAWFGLSLALIGLHRLSGTGADDTVLRGRLLDQVRRESRMAEDPSDWMEGAMRIVASVPGGVPVSARRTLRAVLLQAVADRETQLDLLLLSTLSERLDAADELSPLVGALVLRGCRADIQAASWDAFIRRSERVSPDTTGATPVSRLIARVVHTHAAAQGRQVGVGTVADLWVRQMAKEERPRCGPTESLWGQCCESASFWGVLIACDADVTRDAPEQFWKLALQRPDRTERQHWIRRLAQRTRRDQAST